MISAILLAAGKSRRIGKPKQVLPLGSSTILEQTVDNLLRSKIDDLIVVLGYAAQEVMKKIANRPVKIAINPAYEQGMSTSIVTGLRLVDNKAQAVMLALADQPFIYSKTIDSLIEAFFRHNKGIIIPTYQGRRGHPVIFAIKYKEELLKLTGDIGGRQIIKRHSEDVVEMPVDSESINVDIDTLSDYYSKISAAPCTKVVND
ncbi:Nicotine blue oxidoreductase [subsurface metagenome]